jgi:electron transfer flavoprotein beta subunit
LKIVVCVKQTPDTAATVTVQEGKISWGDAPQVLNPWDEFAVEEALRTKEAEGGEVIVLSLGPEDATEAIKQSLAMGADQAYLISDPLLAGADSLMVSGVLASAIEKIGEVDLVFFGRATVDSDTGVTSAQVARRLGWPALSLVAAIHSMDAASSKIEVERMMDEGRMLVESTLPAVISVVKEINEPRYPSFMGIRKASRAEIPVWTLADLGDSISTKAAVTWPEVFSPPVIDTQCEFIEGESAEQVAKKLAERLLEEKVI